MAYLDRISDENANKEYYFRDVETAELLSHVVKKTTNLYDVSTRSRGYQLKSSPEADGSIVEAANWDTSNYIPVTPGVTYEFHWYDTNKWGTDTDIQTRYAFYDSDLTYLSGNTLPSMLHKGAVAPENAAFLRVSMYKEHFQNVSDYGVVAEASLFPKTYVAYGAVGEYVYADEIATQEEIDASAATKADKAGEAPQLVAGAAEQLVSTTGTVNSAPYCYRANTSGSDMVTISQITGGTLVWNQLIPDTASLDTTSNGVHVEIAGTAWKITGTGSADAWISSQQAIPNIIANHVYAVILSSPIPNGSASGMRFGFTGTGVAGIYDSKIATATASKDSGTRLQIRIVNGAEWNMDSHVCVYDLTQMFGATVAAEFQRIETATPGAGISLFQQMIPESYYPYNAGELLSVQTSGRVSGGYTYPLDGTLELHGIPVLTDAGITYDGDKYMPDGTVTRRYKKLVLNNTETWKKGNYSANPNVVRVYMDLPDAVVGSIVLNDQGYNGNQTGQGLGNIRIANNNGTPILDVYLDINVYADANAWRSHLAESPMTVVYSLATEVTETASPYQEVQIAGATEEFLDSPVPVGSVSLYQANLRDGLETLLDTDLAHAESIAPVQGATASTNIASGELLMRDGKLYQATQAIVAGAEIGATNTTETTLAARLAALEARIAALEN